MRTFLLLEVKLIDKLPGTIYTTYEVGKEGVETLRGCPDSLQAFIRMQDGRCFSARYESAKWDPAGFNEVLSLHICEECGEEKATAQALIAHVQHRHRKPDARQIVQPPATPRPVQSKR